MKPHIRMINRIWFCTGRNWEAWGYSPREAYRHWRDSLADDPSICK